MAAGLQARRQKKPCINTRPTYRQANKYTHLLKAVHRWTLVVNNYTITLEFPEFSDFPAVSADQRDEDAGFTLLLLEAVADPVDDGQVLIP